MHRIISVAIIAGTLAACSGTTPTPAPPNLAQDAAACGIALALAGVMNGPASIPAAIQATPACLNLPADILSAVAGNATTQATAARRTMRMR